MKKIIVSILVLLFLVGCTDSKMASFRALGNECTIKMYNGGILVGEWTSTGKVTTMTDSDGWEFMDKTTRKLVRVGGDVIIEVN